MVQQQERELGFIEQTMYTEIRQATPEQQAELRTLAATQSLAEFTQTLKQRFAQQARYITEERVAAVLAYDREHQAQMPAPAPAAPVSVQQVQAVAPAQIAPKSGHGFKYSFARSTWITVLWNWFLMLAGKAAEPVLTVSVIYSCARLLPSIHTPVQLDNTIFICQMVALDIGGLSLRKLANQAKKDGEAEGAKMAGRVSTALLTIMGVNVALSVLSSIAPLDPTFEKVAEGILLIARAIMAVLYAFVIHSLHSDQGDTTAPGGPDKHVEDQRLAHLQTTFEQRLEAITGDQAQRTTTLQAQFEQRVTQLADEWSHMLASVRQEQPATPVIDQTAIVNAVIEHFSEQFETAMERLTEQAGRIVPANTLPVLPEHLNAKQRAANSTKIVHLKPRSSGNPSNHKDAIFALLQADETRGPRELARLAGCSPATAKSYRDLYISPRSEHNGTAN